MAKLPFQGIARIATSEDLPTLLPIATSDAVAPHAKADVPPGLRPIGIDAVEIGRASRARSARWWSAAKRLFS